MSNMLTVVWPRDKLKVLPPSRSLRESPGAGRSEKRGGMPVPASSAQRREPKK
jgi:hypothetical protein